MASGLYKDGVSCIAQSPGKLLDLGLQQGLPAGQFYELALVLLDLADYFLDRHRRPA
jgi:hypothetical protein